MQGPIKSPLKTAKNKVVLGLPANTQSPVKKPKKASIDLRSENAFQIEVINDLPSK